MSRRILGSKNIHITDNRREDLLSKNLTQFDVPLVEGTDAPDSILNEGDVLIQGDQFTEDT